jgi:23S rRNA (guanosine2251-2'-O)-methyltransferase
LRSVLAEAERNGLPVRWVESSVIDAQGLRDHQGVAALVNVPPELDERDLRSSRFEPDALVVVLDGITDPQNLGACVRSAEAAGAAMLITRKRRAAPLSPAAVRASAGAMFHLPVARVTNISRTLDQLKERGFRVVGLDHRADATIHESPPPPRPVALVVGAEDVGLSRLVRESCDELVAIPMAGKTSSLNASAALAAALFGYVLRP